MDCEAAGAITFWAMAIGAAAASSPKARSRIDCCAGEDLERRIALKTNYLEVFRFYLVSVDKQSRRPQRSMHRHTHAASLYLKTPSPEVRLHLRHDASNKMRRYHIGTAPRIHGYCG